ncbi:MarR family winged helix-turn-helix transcriptional regulator [Vibrio sp. MA40-2]|uniref:MarR family winged helix-turn-helix transcriptional regulator n=1 Tax=Vibrio sp. MA40-2 TaxID=3391828 RepID=UPI0039A42ECE
MNNVSISDSVFTIMHLYRLTMRSKLNATDIGLHSMHVKCLTFIDRNTVCTANDIASFFSRDKSQIARLIKEMIDKNWVTKVANPQDKRSQLLSLTEQGKSLANLIADTQRDVQEKIQKNLSTEELEEFKRVADIIANTLRER